MTASTLSRPSFVDRSAERARVAELLVAEVHLDAETWFREPARFLAKDVANPAYAEMVARRRRIERLRRRLDDLSPVRPLGVVTL